MTISQRMKQSGPWAVIVAQWVERTLPTPEVRGSNPVIGEILFTMNCIEKKCTIWWNKDNSGHNVIFYLSNCR